jgi:hypothetical protein
MNTPNMVAGKTRMSTGTQYRLGMPISSKHIMGMPHQTIADARRCGNVFMGLDVRVSFIVKIDYTLSQFAAAPD